MTIQTHPQEIGPRLLLSRYLLAANQTNLALPHLGQLEAQGVAEAAFLLGIYALQHNDIASAIRFTKRAIELNPGHLQSLEQLAQLKLLQGESDGPTLA